MLIFFMCFSPVKIVNPSSWIDPNSGQSLYVTVPCGHCSECIVSYRNEWRNRAYYETLDTFLSSGDSYILFDTLTYRNGNLPHLSDWFDVPKKLDFPCFNKFHIQNFFAKLRRNLSYHGFNVESNLRYFVACEYGDDIRFTRRPHYHLLLFVKTKISLKVLSKAISDAWLYGRTDGVSYRGYQYVVNHNYFTSLTDSERFSVNYVTKYCTKQFSYLQLVEKRLNRILQFDFNLWLQVKDFVQMRHFQSKSFGHDALIRLVGKDNLLKTGKFKIMQSNGYFRFVNLHKSLQRKLLYDYSRDHNGCVHFTLNFDGFAYKKRFFHRQIDFLLNRVAATQIYNYNEIKLQIYDLFFVDGRFRRFDSVDDLIDNSYNITSGLRNYSSVDFSFVRKCIFAATDYGSNKLGYKCNDVLNYVLGIPKNRNDVVSLSNLKKRLISCKTDFVDDYFARKAVKGDVGLDVLKLKHRLDYIHKNSFSYVPTL